MLSKTLNSIREFQIVLENLEGELIDVFIEAYEVILINSYEVSINGSRRSFEYPVISIF